MMTEKKKPEPNEKADAEEGGETVSLTGPTAFTRRFLRRHPERARELLAQLSREERLQTVMKFSGRDRRDIIFLCDDPEALLQALPAPELWRTIKELGEEDSLDLLRMAAPAQIQHIFDLECWHKDQVDPLAAVFWIMLLNQAGPETSLQWFRQTEEEFLLALLPRFFVVYKADPDDQGNEPWRELDNLWTLDDVYYLHFPEPSVAQPIQDFLSMIRSEEPLKFYGLLDAVGFVPPAEEEEKAYRFRMARLADYGFVDFDEALLIYEPLSERQLEEQVAGERDRPGERKQPLSTPPPADHMAQADLPEFLRSALAEIEDPDARADLQLGIAALVNRILIADSMDLARLESVSQAVEKALTFVELGLKRAAHGDREKASLLLQVIPPILLFRAGFSSVLQLGRQAHRFLRQDWPSRIRLGLELLGDDGRRIAALTRPRPCFYAGRDKKGAVVERDFRTEAEVNEAWAALRRAEALGRIFFEALGVEEKELELLKEHYLGEELLWETVFLTATGKAMSGAGFRFLPLSLEEAKSALSLMLTSERPARLRADVRTQVAARLEQALSRRAEMEESDWAAAQQFLADCWRLLEDECRDLVIAELRAEYFKMMVITPPGAAQGKNRSTFRWRPS